MYIQERERERETSVFAKSRTDRTIFAVTTLTSLESIDIFGGVKALGAFTQDIITRVNARLFTEKIFSAQE